MPSSTSLLEADEGESEVPPLVHAFAGMGLEEHPGAQSQNPEQGDESLPFHHHHNNHNHHHHQISHFNFHGTVLDLKPLSLHRPPSGDELHISAAAAAEDEDPEADAGVQAHHLHRHLGMEPPPPPPPPHVETVLLYSGDERGDDAGGSSLAPASSGMAMLPPGVYGGEPGYEAEPSLLSRRKSVNTTECVAVPSSEHVAEIVGRQGKLKLPPSRGCYSVAKATLLMGVPIELGQVKLKTHRKYKYPRVCFY